MLKSKLNKIPKRATGLLLLGTAIGLVSAVLYYQYFAVSSSLKYPLLAKRIQIDQPNVVRVNFTELRKNITDYINNQGEDASKISVYFEYLPTGVAININEKNESIAASLMKLPIVMNLYKAAELGQVNLDEKVPLQREWLNSEYGTLYQKGEGYEISYRDAARLALKDSDNTALLMIYGKLDTLTVEPKNDSLNYLDIDYNIVEDSRAQISARSYASIPKCLYFACFNSKDDSEEMLRYLTESSFNDRLTKYLPEDTKVAHKIGTYSTRYQSDCGIVYATNQNYALCVMVSGEDPWASKVISDISRETYSYINSNK